MDCGNVDVDGGLLLLLQAPPAAGECRRQGMSMCRHGPCELIRCLLLFRMSNFYESLLILQKQLEDASAAVRATGLEPHQAGAVPTAAKVRP